MKSFDSDSLSVAERQFYLQHAIVPRPIALVSTMDSGGRVNLSPFSFFNLFGANPPVCVFSPARRVRDNTIKHTLENLYEVAECVINLVEYPMLARVNRASAEFAKGVNEFREAGLTELPSDCVGPPRVAESPVQLECRVGQILPLGEGPGAGNLVLAEVLRMHFREELLDEGLRPIQEKFDLVARLGGDWYSRLSPDSLFQLAKP